MGDTRNQMENRNKQRRLEKRKKKQNFLAKKEEPVKKSFTDKIKEKVSKKKKPVDEKKKKEKDSTDFSYGMEVIETSLKKMVDSKKDDLEKEKGNEDYNRKALAILETMAYHFDAIEFLVDEYAELK